ncbi:xylosyltransferase oxt [Bacillus rossius redtenbacheri]|uniref:xylosyltransferase oxt n=1 Tax=Bacillus rossius redtenbacheri TaxID=93214 RepID=UPI002FDD0C11
MVSSRAMDIRWIRRYRTFFIIGSIILCIQVFLALKFFPIEAQGEEHAYEVGDLSGRYFIEAAHDVNGGGSLRKVKDGSLVGDDEDSPSNSNAGNSLYNRHKVPPDKMDHFLDRRLSLVGGETVSHRSKHARGTVGGNSTAASLNLEELDFVPVCDIVTKEAVSAIHRAKTQRCKQTIANITCLIQRRLLYPRRLPNSCPSNGFTAGKSLGCYEDKKTFRLLSGYFANLKTTNSPQHCINLCLQSGFQYAGVQYSTECFCGNEEPPSTSRLPDSSCNMKCPADPKQACGGHYTINIYETGISKFTPQVPVEASDEERPPVRIAFLLTLNGRALRQVRRLVKVLFHRDHFFYIHVDARQDYLFRELLVLEHQFKNIKLARHRFATIWGGASLLQMLLTSLGELVELGWQWDFVINLSESDFPIKRNSHLVNFLTANKGRNFVKSHGREVQRFIQKQGLDKTFVECDAHMWRAGDRQLPWGVQVDGGSDWVALSRPFVEYVSAGLAARTDPLIVGLNTVFKYTLLPAESFFHTVLRNSNFCNSYVDNNLHVTNWKRRLGCKCQYKHVVDWCGCSPNDFKVEDWPKLQITENRQLFFARKFEPIINQGIINQLEEWLYGPYPSNVVGVDSYWQSVYHHADLSPPPDDAVVTLMHSLTRHATNLLFSSSGKSCSMTPQRVLEVTGYYHNDSFKGFLILYEVLMSRNLVKFESLVFPQQPLWVLEMIGPFERLKSLYVSSEYDQKEQVSRNTLQVLGPFSEPVLVYQLTAGAAVSAGSASSNVTFLWVDPIGQLADVSEVHVEEGAVISQVKPSLHEPLLPGVWDIKIVYNSTLVAQTHFLVVPLELVSGVEVSQQQTTFLHSGPGQPYDVHHVHLWEKFLPSAEDRQAMHRKAVASSRRFGVDLKEWIDGLTSRFYRVLNSCIAFLPTGNVCTDSHFESCEATMWSSLSADPKATIGSMNNVTGRLNRW